MHVYNGVQIERDPNTQYWEGSEKPKGGSFKFVTPAPKHEGK